MAKTELFEKERAQGYNQFVETWVPNYHYFLDHLPRLLEETPSKKLLVVGCGTGNEIERFINCGYDWSITGVDPSPEMIKQAHDKLKTSNNVKLVEGLVATLKTEEKFTASTLLLVLHFLQDNGDKLVLLKDIAARLVQGASLVLLDITGSPEQIRQNLKILRLLLPKDLDEKLVTQRILRIQNELFSVSEQRLSELLVEAGFTPPLRFFQSAVYMGWLTQKRSDNILHHTLTSDTYTFSLY